MKELIKKLIKAFPIAFTQNQKYDRQTTKVIRKVCKPDSNCIDVGCHKGEVFDIMITYAPQGQHIGFEPIPAMCEALLRKYAGTNHAISPIALSDKKGQVTFNYVLTNPAYSGLQKRQYDKPDEKDTLIEVQTDLLDAVISADKKVDFLKIDVEGGEFGVLNGAKETIKRHKPVIIFEHGLGASDAYGTTPDKVFGLLTECGMAVSTMENWLNGKPPFSQSEFEQQYYEKINYYFIAYSLI